MFEIGNFFFDLILRNFNIITMFRYAFLLSQYSFICGQYFKCSDAQYTQYFFWQLLNKAADCFNQLLLYWWEILVPKQIVQKQKKNSLQEKEKFDNSEKFTKKFFIFYFICLPLLRLSIESVRKIVICSLNIHTYIHTYIHT